MDYHQMAASHTMIANRQRLEAQSSAGNALASHLMIQTAARPSDSNRISELEASVHSLQLELSELRAVVSKALRP